MSHLNPPTRSIRAAAVALLVAPLALVLLAAALYRGDSADLTPLALALPLLAMGALESLIARHPGERRSLPPAGRHTPARTRLHPIMHTA